MPPTKHGSLKAFVLVLALGGQIVLTYLSYDRRASDLITNIGWVILWVAAILGVVPIPTLRKLGGRRKGESYIHTTSLVDRGIYAVVRHPQYLAGILLGIGLSVVSQHWAVVVLGVVVVLVYLRVTREEEQALIARFGAAYERYKQQVPGFNLVVGSGRYLRRRWSE